MEPIQKLIVNKNRASAYNFYNIIHQMVIDNLKYDPRIRILSYWRMMDNITGLNPEIWAKIFQDKKSIYSLLETYMSFVFCLCSQQIWLEFEQIYRTGKLEIEILSRGEMIYNVKFYIVKKNISYELKDPYLQLTMTEDHVKTFC